MVLVMNCNYFDPICLSLISPCQISHHVHEIFVFLIRWYSFSVSFVVLVELPSKWLVYSLSFDSSITKLEAISWVKACSIALPLVSINAAFLAPILSYIPSFCFSISLAHYSSSRSSL